MSKGIILFLFVLASFASFSQVENDSIQYHTFFNNLCSKNNNASIIISQDTLINRLIEKHISINQADINLYGWRIQIYNSSGKEARDEANEVRNKFMNTYFDVKAYLIYQPPFFKIRVGDYRNKQEAFALYKTLLTVYPLSYLVQEKINLPTIQ